jgi:hypothetical protein
VGQGWQARSVRHAAFRHTHTQHSGALTYNHGNNDDANRLNLQTGDAVDIPITINVNLALADTVRATYNVTRYALSLPPHSLGTMLAVLTSPPYQLTHNSQAARPARSTSRSPIRFRWRRLVELTTLPTPPPGRPTVKPRHFHTAPRWHSEGLLLLFVSAAAQLRRCPTAFLDRCCRTKPSAWSPTRPCRARATRSCTYCGTTPRSRPSRSCPSISPQVPFRRCTHTHTQ